ncbi:hypothetical protein [Streptomyces subrutilus]|uniref:hypothetical protein n=1 Tax=Streptomyces subrutilus TaxID=36818 RepID=UPI003F4CC7D5
MVRVGVYGCFATVLAGHFFTPHAGSRGGAGPLIATYASFALAFFSLAFFSRPALTELTGDPDIPRPLRRRSLRPQRWPTPCAPSPSPRSSRPAAAPATPS